MSDAHRCPDKTIAFSLFSPLPCPTSKPRSLLWRSGIHRGKDASEAGMSGTKSVQTEGADIVFDYEGSGPVLLLIAGAGGEAHRYAALSALMKDRYTVVRYDRRCNSRSSGDRTAPLDVAQQGRDAVAILGAMEADRAYVFGSSAGGTIACQIAQAHPERITAMVVHEPAIQAALPDAAEVLKFFDMVDAKLASEGTMPAMMLFGSSLRGMPPPPPNGERRGLAASENVEFFMHQEFHSISHHRPDLALIARNGVAMVAAAGRLSEDVYYARTAHLLSDVTGCPFRMMSGHHLAYVADPATFARELSAIFEELAPPHAT